MRGPSTSASPPGRCGAALALAAGLIAVATAATAQGEPEAPRFPVASVAVNVYAVVSDRNDRLVSELPRGAFRLWEDGVPRTIEHFARGGDRPLSLGLLIDTSPSQEHTLAAQREEAKKFLAGVLGPGDRAFLMRFDLSVELVQGFSGDLALLTRAVERVRVSPTAWSLPPGQPARGRGATRLLDALSFAASELMEGEQGRKVLVLVTDGADRGSLVSRRSALDACDRADVIAYAVAVADPTFYWLRGESYDGLARLEGLTAATGGRVVRADGPDTAAAFGQIARELRAHFRLGYSPAPGGRSGRRRIEVRVTAGGHKVRTRRGYYLRGE